MLKAKSTKSSPVKMKQPFFPSIRQKTQIKQYRVLRKKSFINNSFDLHPLPQLRRIRRQSYQEGCNSKKIQVQKLNKLLRIDCLQPKAYIQQHIKNLIIQQNRRKGLFGKIKDVLRRSMQLKSTLNFWMNITQKNKKKQSQQIQFRKATIKGRDKKYEWLLAQKGRQSVLVQTDPRIVIKRELSSSGSSVSSIPMDAQETQRQGNDKRQFTLLNLDKFRIKPIMYQKHLATYTDRQEIPFVKRQITQFSTTTKASNSTNLYLRLGQQQLKRKV